MLRQVREIRFPIESQAMLARRLAPLVGLVALAAFLALRLPIELADSWKRVRHAWRDRVLDADSALALMRGPDYVAAIRHIREELPADSEYLLLGGADGGDVFVRFDLAPRRAIFGGNPKDVGHNVTLAKLPALPEWTIIPLLDRPGPRLVKTRLLAERGAVP
jgi:hypothetical protein